MIKILVVTSQFETGLSYHRQSVPHRHLVANYDTYQVDYAYDISEATKEELSPYQIVSFLRCISQHGKTKEILDNCKSAGCVTILDIDDYWHLHPSHELSSNYKENKITEQTIESVQGVDWVTTTTEHFASKIREFNKNVTVLPNSIDPTIEQYKHNLIESERTRLGWIGGVYHTPDIALMHNGMKEVWKTINPSKFQFCLGGFYVPSAIEHVNNALATRQPNAVRYHFEAVQKALSQGMSVPIEMIFRPQIYGIDFNNVPPYVDIEFLYTDGYKYPQDKEYKKYLSKYERYGNEIGDNQPYKRLWGTKDVNQYAKLYNSIDVALVPLVDNGFNSYKSQIKIIEAGWFKKAVIVSKVLPYTIDCNPSNSIMITPSKRNEGWGFAMKSLILNPNKVEDLAEAMHEVVKENYMMDKTNVVRNQLYLKLCE